jgi:hypothetical protein
MRLGLVVVALLMMPAGAMAQADEPTSAPSSERRLTPEQIEAVLAEAAKKREAAGGQIDPDVAEPAPGDRIQGEVGVSVGTGGYREVFGTAIYPLGDDGAAAISLDFVDLGKRRLPR